MHRDKRLRILCATLTTLSIVGVSACSGSSSNEAPSGPEPQLLPPSPSGLPALPEITYEEAYEQVPPLEGTPPVTISWELPDIDDPDLVEALQVMRMFVALEEDENRLKPQAPYEKAYLYYFLATEEYADFLYPFSLEPAATPLMGPLWYWVMDLRRTAKDEVQVDTCVDIGWFVSDPDDAPRQTPYRGALRTYIIKLVADEDGVERWKVGGVDPNARERIGHEAQNACNEWAVHTPEEVVSAQ